MDQKTKHFILAPLPQSQKSVVSDFRVKFGLLIAEFLKDLCMQESGFFSEYNSFHSDSSYIAPLFINVSEFSLCTNLL